MPCAWCEMLLSLGLQQADKGMRFPGFRSMCGEFASCECSGSAVRHTKVTVLFCRAWCA